MSNIFSRNISNIPPLRQKAYFYYLCKGYLAFTDIFIYLFIYVYLCLCIIENFQIACGMVYLQSKKYVHRDLGEPFIL
jgi:serine/threonine protein kinase